jgi:general secretion pathway protein G
MKKGFTFIELVVVITIIAVLSVAGIISYSSATKKSRDARRISDLEKIRMALEMVRQTGTTYPSNANYSSVLVPNYLQALPVDPKTNLSSSYFYNQTGSGYTYILCATMEDMGSTNVSTGCGGPNYKVTNP